MSNETFLSIFSDSGLSPWSRGVCSCLGLAQLTDSADSEGNKSPFSVISYFERLDAWGWKSSDGREIHSLWNDHPFTSYSKAPFALFLRYSSSLLFSASS